MHYNAYWIQCIQLGMKQYETTLNNSDNGFLINTKKQNIQTYILVCVYFQYRCCLVTKSYLSLLLPHGLQPTRLLCPWDFPGKNTGVGCHCLLQGTFPTQGLKLHLLHQQAGSLPLSHQGNCTPTVIHTHTHTHINIYLNGEGNVCVCIYISIYVYDIDLYL